MISFLVGGCCLLAVFLNPLLFLEKTFAAPIYWVKSFNKSNTPLLPPKEKYKLVLVGDSLTEFLGNNEALKADLKKYYPNKNFEIDNYGFGSTNILSLEDRLTKETKKGTQAYPPILKQNFDIIIIESFANNPLSQYPLNQGLQIQTQTLDKIIKLITDSHPHSVIVFLATISPNRVRYGEGVVTLSPEQRKSWADERIAYMENHIKYSQSHHIYLINVFDKSKDANGDGNIDYLSGNDFIHPSVTGIEFISQNIADYIFEKRIIPL